MGYDNSSWRYCYVNVDLNWFSKQRNDGSVAGKKYFTCAPKKGIFVLPEEIENESP